MLSQQDGHLWVGLSMAGRLGELVYAVWQLDKSCTQLPTHQVDVVLRPEPHVL
jgi:hypothetical protein